MKNPRGGRLTTPRRTGALALLGSCTIGLAALAGCGSSDGGGSAANVGDVDCAALEAPLVATVVVGSFAMDADDSAAEVDGDDMAAAVAELPPEYREMGDAVVALMEQFRRVEAEDTELMSWDEESQRAYDEFEAEYADDLEAATYWAAERCAGDRVVWACYDGNTKARFRPVGRAISEDGEPSIDVAGDTPEDVLEVDGWTEVLRTDGEAVFAELDEDGRAVAVRTAEWAEASDWQEEGWGKVFDLSCSDPTTGF